MEYNRVIYASSPVDSPGSICIDYSIPMANLRHSLLHKPLFGLSKRHKQPVRRYLRDNPIIISLHKPFSPLKP
jgi:hypothetical protein